MAARHEEGWSETYTSTHFLIYEGLSEYGVGVAKGTVFRDTRPGAGWFQNHPAISFEKSWGGLP